ncbi:TPA: tail fiber assembly protein [Serratia marcescens]
MDEAQLNHELIATIAGNITVFNFDGETREYLSSSVEYLAVGVGVPANSCVDSPLVKRDHLAVCRTADHSAWEYITDYRGETAYSKENGQPVIISVLGDYPPDTTSEAPATPYDSWSGTAWVTDTDKKHAADVEMAEQEKKAILEDARKTISLWQTELQLGIISDEDKASLINWLTYIKEVEANEVSTVPDINWPVPPAQ